MGHVTIHQDQYGTHYVNGGRAGEVKEYGKKHLDLDVVHSFVTVKQARKYAEAIIEMCEWKEKNS